MKSKYTLEPWTAFIGKHGTISVFGKKIGTRQKEIISWTGFDNCSYPVSQQKANAHLISAAPDMLIALKLQLSINNPTRESSALLTSIGWDAGIISARAFITQITQNAINKAEGKKRRKKEASISGKDGV